MASAFGIAPHRRNVPSNLLLIHKQAVLSRALPSTTRHKEGHMPAEPLRMDLTKIAPDAYRHFLQLEEVIGRHVDRKLLHLIKLRASQINGCAFCIAMHTDERCATGRARSG